MTRPIALTLTLAATWATVWLSASGLPSRTNETSRAAVTFSEDVAPILYQNCVTCHRPGEAAPFALISYEDAVKRGPLMASVTKARYMPPWHAEPGFGDFADERRLTDAQIETIAEWVAQRMPRGDAARMPKLPTFTDGWQLGKPDLVLEMPEAFDVPASGPDIFRNFAIPTGLTENRYVRAVEFRPGARQVVHHALFGFARGGAVADLIGADGKPGFSGAMPVRFVPAFAPAGDLGGWAVGTTPRFLPENLSWTMNKGSDFILQLHLHPTGKPERERSTIGLYFADAPPPRKVRGMSAALVLGAFVAACHDPDSKMPTSPSAPALVSVDIGGPATVEPGHSVQLVANAHMSDGSTKAVTSGTATGISTGRIAMSTSSRSISRRARRSM